MDEVICRISMLLSDQKKTQKELSDFLGIGHGTFTHWKNDNRKTFYQYIPEISAFLHTTPDYLLLGDTDSGSLSPFESEVLQLPRKATKEQQEIIQKILINFTAQVY